MLAVKAGYEDAPVTKKEQEDLQIALKNSVETTSLASQDYLRFNLSLYLLFLITLAIFMSFFLLLIR